MSITTDQFNFDDIDVFISTVASEELVCNKWEFEFLLHTFPQGCFVCRADGFPVAFITSLGYGLRGWVSNLYVRTDWRGRGLGKMLTELAINSLLSSGVQSIWLSASKEAKGIYQTLGFIGIDAINLWMGRSQAGMPGGMTGIDGDMDRMIFLDQACWGNRRDDLMTTISKQGTVFAKPNAFIVIRRWNTGFMLMGPWVGKTIAAADEVFGVALAQISPSEHVFLYAPDRNFPIVDMLISRGFHIAETTALMSAGSGSTYDPAHIFGFVSMGLG